jgi:carboxyl-terminal processing protease
MDSKPEPEYSLDSRLGMKPRCLRIFGLRRLRLAVWAAGSLWCAWMAGFGNAGAAEGEAAGKEPAAYAPLAVFAKVLQLVRQDYVDEAKASYQALIMAALRGMLSSLDPHSQYLEAREYKAVQDDTRSRFSGVGVVLALKDGKLVVMSTMEGGPAVRAGILAGDQVLRVEGQLAEKLGSVEAANLLRGDSGAAVSLTIYRPSTQDTFELELQRESINVPSVRDAGLVLREGAGDSKIGYVRLTQFNTTTAAELLKALEELEKSGMQGLILDLRGNPGGLLEAAIEVASHFLPAGSLVVSTEGRVNSQNKFYRTPAGSAPRANYPVALLVNGASASAAEILAGALRDLRRAVLVGETTFGKGSVQSVIPLQDGTAIRLTTAKYYTPGKQVIHEQGIQPTIRAPFSADQERLLALQRRGGALSAAEKAELAGFVDTQLERAAETLRAVLLYSVRTEKNVSSAGVGKQN